MIVDKNGRMFEDRRKKNSDRRKVDKSVSVDKRKGERRKSKNQMRNSLTNGSSSLQLFICCSSSCFCQSQQALAQLFPTFISWSGFHHGTLAKKTQNKTDLSAVLIVHCLTLFPSLPHERSFTNRTRHLLSSFTH